MGTGANCPLQDFRTSGLQDLGTSGHSSSVVARYRPPKEKRKIGGRPRRRLRCTSSPEVPWPGSARDRRIVLRLRSAALAPGRGRATRCGCAPGCPGSPGPSRAEGGPALAPGTGPRYRDVRRVVPSDRGRRPTAIIVIRSRRRSRPPKENGEKTRPSTVPNRPRPRPRFPELLRLRGRGR